MPARIEEGDVHLPSTHFHALNVTLRGVELTVLRVVGYEIVLDGEHVDVDDDCVLQLLSHLLTEVAQSVIVGFSRIVISREASECIQLAVVLSMQRKRLR